MAKIGLIDADLMWGKRPTASRYGKSKSDIYPNLALMKISAYHKAKGDEVEWYMAFNDRYDKVYVSKVFSSTPVSKEYINADIVVCGGTGFQIHLADGKEVFQEDVYFDTSKQAVLFSKNLPEDVEHMMPDYSLYPTVKDTAYGFLSRGCPRGCGFCHVAAKEGKRAYKMADLKEWWRGQKNIVLMDPNILACRDWRDLMQQLVDSKARIDINQGLDARLLTKEKVEMLNKMKLASIHFAWDDYKQKDAVLKGLKIFADNFSRKMGHQAQVYVLTNFDTEFEQDLERVYTLRDMQFEPYIMIYDKPHAAHKYKSLQRWVNQRAIFHSVETFEEYDKKRLKNDGCNEGNTSATQEICQNDGRQAQGA